MRWTDVRSVSCLATSERSESASDCIRFSFDADDWSCASTSLIFDAACWGRRRVQRTSSRRAHGTGRAGGLSRDDLGLLLPLLPQSGHLLPEPCRLGRGGILLDPPLQLGYLRRHGVVLPQEPLVLGLHPGDVVEGHHVARLGGATLEEALDLARQVPSGPGQFAVLTLQAPDPHLEVRDVRPCVARLAPRVVQPLVRLLELLQGALELDLTLSEQRSLRRDVPVYPLHQYDQLLVLVPGRPEVVLRRGQA
mmetsp:Transcript_32544/g.73126  ORF Transcript_32544/g.73126 Transcript_32544/m.73126 type:complete len:251 (+) Transcript_32544:1304-2056(+)